MPEAVQAIKLGAVAYFDAMSVPGRSRLLLLDLPAVLGHAAAADPDLADGQSQLRDGLAQAFPQAASGELDAMTDILSAAFDRTALAIAQGGDKDSHNTAMLTLLERSIAG